MISVRRIRGIFICAVLLAAAMLIFSIPDMALGDPQDVESGDSSQTITATGGGDNSNACQGIQGISNTGNAVTKTNVLQYASFGEVEVDDSGNFEISPSSTTTCEQQVNQAASASG